MRTHPQGSGLRGGTAAFTREWGKNYEERYEPRESEAEVNGNMGFCFLFPDTVLLTTLSPTKDNACKIRRARRIDLDGFSGEPFPVFNR